MGKPIEEYFPDNISHCKKCGSTKLEYGYRYKAGVNTFVAFINAVVVVALGRNMGASIASIHDIQPRYYCGVCGSFDIYFKPPTEEELEQQRKFLEEQVAEIKRQEQLAQKKYEEQQEKELLEYRRTHPEWKKEELKNTLMNIVLITIFSILVIGILIITFLGMHQGQ
jgi:ribosomal protein S27AE